MMIWVVVVGLALIAWMVSAFNLATWRRGSTWQGPVPELSVLIPARNEERNIEHAVRSVLRQEKDGVPLASEVVIYDDGSTDKTALLVQGICREDSRVRLVEGGTLPPGWIGKPYACHRLAQEARGDLLMFMDADVGLKDAGLERLLSLTDAPAHGALVSAVPAQICGSFIERLVMPLLTLTYTAWLPLRLVEWGSDPRTVAANGQLLLMSRKTYTSIGGFRSVRNELVDDVAICKIAKSHGLRVIFADGFKMATCRMYRSGAETINGFSKNLHEGVGGTAPLLAACALYLAAFVLPYVALLAAVIFPEAAGSWLVPALAGVALNVTLRAALALRFSHPWEGLLLHPFAVLALCGIAFNSWRWTRRGAIAWAGRNYRPKRDRAHEVTPDTLRSERLSTGAPT